MISDPKLPLASEPTRAGEMTSPLETPVAGTRPESSSAAVSAPSSIAPSLARLWMRRIGVLLFVFLCATLGVMLMILPWRPDWSDNPLLIPYPALRAFMAGGFARGVATGLGLLNVWIGFWEAIQYQEG